MLAIKIIYWNNTRKWAIIISGKQTVITSPSVVASTNRQHDQGEYKLFLIILYQEKDDVLTEHTEEIVASTDKPLQTKQKSKQTSKRVSDHLANERTFLAWMRTSLATITFGFVVERFGLLLRELGFKGQQFFSLHFSSIFGVSLTILGVIIMIVALANFLHIRQAIDNEEFHPPVNFAIVLTVLTSLIGILLALYLMLTA